MVSPRWSRVKTHVGCLLCETVELKLLVDNDVCVQDGAGSLEPVPRKKADAGHNGWRTVAQDYPQDLCWKALYAAGQRSGGGLSLFFERRTFLL